VGAGTVLDPATVDRARDAGASFIVAPGYNATVLARSAALGLPMIPGALTPTEIERALSDGVTLVKVFPAEAAGGVPYLRAIAAPYRAARFMPTGGVTTANLASYLSVPAVVACGGTWIAPADTIRAHDWPAITTASREARAIVTAARG
jgi:2-dehydro-3-deoxyphosphogluconate aldolase / (4S)-4-hydroxy-2-oxoglutarate aldolase